MKAITNPKSPISDSVILSKNSLLNEEDKLKRNKKYVIPPAHRKVSKVSIG
ncbi:MAG: hypothetical protein QOE22_701 [Candidatus Parcubacteria bacterium]|nr:hypothetical protein [Candidatus Parcubacteria bacterium]